MTESNVPKGYVLGSSTYPVRMENGRAILDVAPEDRLYRGIVFSDGRRAVEVSRRVGATFFLPPRLDLFKHSPTGLNWGYSGSGPAQLALAILADHFTHRPEAVARFREWACFRGLTDREWWGMQDVRADDAAVAIHQKFKNRVISGLPDGPWALTSSDVDGALASIYEEGAQ